MIVRSQHKPAQHLGVSVSTLACPFPITKRPTTRTSYSLQGRSDKSIEEGKGKTNLSSFSWDEGTSGRARTGLFGAHPNKRLNYFRAPFGELQQRFQRAMQNFLYDSSLAFLHRVTSAHETRSCIAICTFHSQHSALFQAQRTLSYTGEHPRRGLFTAAFLLFGDFTRHSKYKQCSQSSATRKYYSTYRGDGTFSIRFETQISNYSKQNYIYHTSY